MRKNVTADELFESAMMHQASGDKPAAVLQFQECIQKRPDHSDAWHNRGLILLQLGHPFDAMLNVERALALSDKKFEYHNTKGVALAALNRHEDAIECYDCSIKLNPKNAATHMNRGNSLRSLGQVTEAIACYQRSVEVDPSYLESRLNLAVTLLADGQLKEGWKQFEWRWKSGQLPPRGLPYPQWVDEPMPKGRKSILVYAEQGFGDALQFIRYAPMIKQRFPDAIVWVEVRMPLVRLARTVVGIDGVLPYGEKPPFEFDLCVPMMSLPRLLGSDTFEQVPDPGRYFHPDQHRVAFWKRYFDAFKDKKAVRVGVCWAGMNRPHQASAADIDTRRSMTLEQFAPLAIIPGINWISLQKGPPSGQVSKPLRGLTIADWTEDLEDFYDTASLIDCCDLVISVDTSVVHLAAALGKPTWLLSRWDTCWRWFGHRTDSPWYGSLTQYAQPSPGDWEAVMEKVAVDLRRFVGKRYPAHHGPA